MTDSYFGNAAADKVAEDCIAAKHDVDTNPFTGEVEAWLCEDCEATIDDIFEGILEELS